MHPAHEASVFMRILQEGHVKDNVQEEGGDYYNHTNMLASTYMYM